MVNGKCRQGDSIIATDFIQSNHSSYITSSKCLMNMSKSIKTTTTTTSSSSIATTPTLTKNNTTTVLPHRKVFMITEKSGETDEQLGLTDKTIGGRKRKMILIMDEKPQVDVQRQNGNKHMKVESHKTRAYTNGATAAATVAGAPKLLFFANSVDDQLSHKIEEILPEILSRIQWKNGRVDVNVDGNEVQQQQEIQDNNINEKKHQHIHGHLPEEFSDNSNSELAALSNNNNNSNLMLLGAAAAATAASRTTETMQRITLPPKKNHSKIQKQLVSNNGGTQIISAATPVIVSTTSLNKSMSNPISNSSTTIADIGNNGNNGISCHFQSTNKSNHTNVNGKMQLQQQSQQYNHQNIHRSNSNSNSNINNTSNNNGINNNTNNATINDQKNSIVVQQQNINLTGDFLFLMKMLPMLEKTPEPRKTQVKLLIEKIMKQCVAGGNPP